MKRPVTLSLCGTQHYPGQEPDSIELMTEGTLEFRDGGWDICYQESALTGMEGVETIFRVEPGQVILRRTGKLKSEMVFQEGVSHNSLYQMDFGTLMITITAKQVQAEIDNRGGSVDLVYSIEIEQGQAGLVEYHLEICTRE